MRKIQIPRSVCLLIGAMLLVTHPATAAEPEPVLKPGDALAGKFVNPPEDSAYMWPASPKADQEGLAIAEKSVLNLNKSVGPDGTLTWDVPPGEWIVRRMSLVSTGARNGPAPAEATGLEVDKMSRPHLKTHFDAYIGSSWAASPVADPPEPERLRSMPRPADLPLEPGPFKGNWDSIAAQFICPEWFFDAKFGIWAHWSADSAGEAGDWYHQRLYCEGTANYKSHVEKFGHPSKVGYKDVVQTWKAEKFDPDALMAYFKENGARFFFTIGVHMNNFDNWNSKYHRWNAVNMGPHKDIVGLWQAAAKKVGMPFGITEHLASRYLPENWHAYAAIFAGHYGIRFDNNGYGLEPWSPLKGKKFPCNMPVMGTIQTTME